VAGSGGGGEAFDLIAPGSAPVAAGTNGVERGVSDHSSDSGLGVADGSASGEGGGGPSRSSSSTGGGSGGSGNGAGGGAGGGANRWCGGRGGAASSVGWQYLQHYVRVLQWLPQYKWRTDLWPDLTAAAAEVIVATPEAIAYASIAGLRAENGLFSAMMGPIGYSMVGSSRQLLTGPTAIMSILTRSSVPAVWAGAPVVEGSDTYVRVAALLAIITGLIQLALHFSRAGFLARLVSAPVMLGFITGSALLIAATQFSNLLGVPKCVGPGGASCTFAASISNVVRSGAAIKWPVPVAAIAVIVILVAWKFGLPRILPRRLVSLRLVGPLVVVIVGCALSSAYGGTLKTAGLSHIEEIPAGLPSPKNPFPTGVSASDLGALFVAAVPTSLIGYVESLTIARTVARQCGGYEIDAVHELFSIGFATLVAGVSRGYPVTGSFSRTAVMASSGARTQMASLAAGVLIIPVLLWATSALSLLPKVVPAAIIMTVIKRLIEVHEALLLYRTDLRDFFVFVVVFFVTVFVDVVPALIAGIALQWLVGLTRSSVAKTPVRWFGWLPEAPTSAAAATGVPAPPAAVGAAAAAAAAAPAALLYGPLAARVAARLRLLPDFSTARTGHRSGMSFVELYDCPPPAAAAAAAAAATAVAASIHGGSTTLAIAGGSGDKNPGGPSGGSAGSVAIATGTSRLPAGAVLLTFSPDLQFHNIDRLRAHVEEAIACYGPAAVVIDLSRCSAVDSTGAYGLIGLADSMYALHGVHTLVAAASDPLLRVLVNVARARRAFAPAVPSDLDTAAGHAARGGGSSDSGSAEGGSGGRGGGASGATAGSDGVPAAVDAETGGDEVAAGQLDMMGPPSIVIIEDVPGVIAALEEAPNVPRAASPIATRHPASPRAPATSPPASRLPVPLPAAHVAGAGAARIGKLFVMDHVVDALAAAANIALWKGPLEAAAAENMSARRRAPSRRRRAREPFLDAAVDTPHLDIAARLAASAAADDAADAARVTHSRAARAAAHAWSGFRRLGAELHTAWASLGSNDPILIRAPPHVTTA